MALPVIPAGNRHLPDLTAETLAAFKAANEPPRVFVRSGSLCRVRQDERGRALIDLAGEPILRSEVARAAHFMKEGKNGPYYVTPPRDLIQDIMALGAWELPILNAVIETPALRPDGSILCRPGFDPATGLYLVLPPGFPVLSVPDKPDEVAVQVAITRLKDVLSEFPFVDDACLANALALLLTPVLRPAIDGPVPLALIDAPRAGTGKTLMAEAVHMLATGRDVATLTTPYAEDAWEKLILTLISEGSMFILLDEVPSPLNSRALSAALTSNVYKGRRLGVSESLSAPQRATWVATGNNIRLGGDVPRRCYWIRVDPQSPQPWLRDGFKRADLCGWVRENRAKLLTDILILGRAWFTRGCPAGTNPVIGKFDGWCRMLGGVLEMAGVTGFLGNLDGLYGQMDEDDAQWERFLTAIHAMKGESAWTVAQLIGHLERDDKPAGGAEGLRGFMPEELNEAFEKATRSGAGGTGATKKIAKALNRIVDRCYGEARIQVRKAGSDSHSKVTQWQTVKFAGFAGFDIAPNA